MYRSGRELFLAPFDRDRLSFGCPYRKSRILGRLRESRILTPFDVVPLFITAALIDKRFING